MAKLKLGPLVDDKPVRLTVEMAAQVHRDLVDYAEVLGQQTESDAVEPTKLVGPMLARFMATDRAFAKARRRAGPDRPGGSEVDLRPELDEQPDAHGSETDRAPGFRSR